MHPAARSASADAAADAPDELARRRHFTTGGLLDAAGQAFPAAGAGNAPSLREIQRALRIGQGKAKSGEWRAKRSDAGKKRPSKSGGGLFGRLFG
jgi:hypothetical protein